MILDEVQNFDNFPDGRLRAGPFDGDPGMIADCLHHHGLRLGADEERGLCSRTILGTMISCAGPGVTGYLLDEGGLEAPSSDIEAFLACMVRSGAHVTIEGHHCPDDTRMVKSAMTAWISNGELMISAERVLYTRDGDHRDLLRQAPVAVSRPGAPSAPRLSLVV